MLPEHRAKHLLRELGIDVPRGRLVHSANEAVAFAEEAGFPLACKLQALALTHKSDVGAVALGINDKSTLEAAFQRLDSIGKERGIPVDGVLVEEMAAGEHELIVGAVRDPDFGPHVMVGAGGVFAEIVDDVVVVAAPASEPELRRAMETMRMWPLLSGARGGDPVDVDALIELASLVSELIIAAPVIQEIDLNPVVVRVAGEGCCVLDALIG